MVIRNIKTREKTRNVFIEYIDSNRFPNGPYRNMFCSFVTFYENKSPKICLPTKKLRNTAAF